MFALIEQAEPIHIVLWALWLFAASLYPLGFMLGSKCSSCCNESKCPLGSCTVRFEFLDENECEDDVFDFYLENPTTGNKRFIQTVDLVASPAGSCKGLGSTGGTYANILIPVVISETDFDENCEVFVVLEFKSANCCNTYTRFRIIKPDNTILLGTYFSQSGLKEKYTWKQLCEPSPPPPPPKACCVIETKCDDSFGSGVSVGSCTGVEPQCCVTSGYTQQECNVANPPGVTLCQNGFETRSTPPYDCTNSGTFDPLMLQVITLTLPEISGPTPTPLPGDELPD